MRVSQPLVSGLFFIAFGALALYVGADLQKGTSAEMGTGYVPRMLAIGCVAIGCVQLVQAWLRRRASFEAVSIPLLPLALVTGMVVAFALLLPRLGLPITVAITIGAAAVSGERFRWLPLASITIGMAVMTTLLFAWALGLQIPVWPNWWPQ